MYKKVSTNMNFIDREQEVLAFWKDNDIFKKSIKEREGCPTYMFYDGNGMGKTGFGYAILK